MEGCSVGSNAQPRGNQGIYSGLSVEPLHLVLLPVSHWKSPKMKGSGSTNVSGSWPLGCNLIGHDPSISQSVNQSFNQLIHPSINRSISQGWTVIFHQAELWWVILAPFPWWSPKTWRWRQLDVELIGKKAPLLIWFGKFSTCWAKNPHRKSDDEYLLRKKRWKTTKQRIIFHSCSHI